MANKGEWSEPYAAIRILADGRLYLAGNNGHRDLSEWMDVLSLYRLESVTNGSKHTDRDVRYYVHMDKGNIEIQIDNLFAKNIDVERFKCIADVLKHDIISGNSSSFSVSNEAQEFLVEAEIHSLKAKSINKSDVFITIRDPRASIIREDVGFSIKSEFGKPPTIFNTAKASGAKYRLSDMTDDLMAEINGMVDDRGNAAVTERCRRLIEAGCDLEFVGYPIAGRAGVAAFYENLDNINPRLVNVIERIMWNHFIEGEKARDIPDVVDIIIKQNPCHVTNPKTKYPTMIKSFLYAGYCGMTASTIWEGDSQVKGGFISVNKEGEVMAYYAMESDAFKNFLYNKCFVDYPSTSSGHGDYARVYKENNEYYFNLNFQIKMHKDD
jgi:hypothetical protein